MGLIGLFHIVSIGRFEKAKKVLSVADLSSFSNHVQQYRIISVAGADVGVIVTVAAPDCLKLNQLFILPDHQGPGIGSRSMSLAMDEARRNDLPVRLRVMKVNPRALVFYRRLGFESTGDTETHIFLEWSP